MIMYFIALQSVILLDGETLVVGDIGELPQSGQVVLGKQSMRGSLSSEGAYETVIVILQDLAAVELEEAFHSVDTVVKSKDYATVVVDR
jgi:hypothetical protein